MPDFLAAFEAAAKAGRTAGLAFAAALTLPRDILREGDARKAAEATAAEAFADLEAETEVNEPTDTLPLNVCPCHAREDSCFWCEDYPVGEFVDEPGATLQDVTAVAEEISRSVQSVIDGAVPPIPAEVTPAVYFKAYGSGGSASQRTYIPRPLETPAAGAVSIAVEEGSPATSPHVAGDAPTFADLHDILAEIAAEHFVTWRNSSNTRCTCLCGDNFLSEWLWAQHLSEIQASAVQDLIQVARNGAPTGQGLGGRWASETFPQYQRPLQK